MQCAALTQRQAQLPNARRNQRGLSYSQQDESAPVGKSFNLELDADVQQSTGDENTVLIADLLDVEGLARVFAKRAYQNELIIFNGDSSPKMLEMVLSTVLKYRSLRYEHWIMATGAERDCTALQVSTSTP